MTNEEIADRLEEVADLLDMDPGENRYRVAAYREGAATIRRMEEPITLIDRQRGSAGLQELHGIGAGLADSIEELIETGRLSLLDRLREQTHPEAAFESLPGVGPVLAARIHEQECLPDYQHHR